MMGPNSEMTGGIGCLYIDGNPLCNVNVSSFEMEEDSEEKYVNECVNKAVVKALDKIVFEYTVQMDPIAWWKVIGLWDWMIRNCPNKRVVYLMNHGKTRRVRLKNFKRTARIAAKILSNV